MVQNPQRTGVSRTMFTAVGQGLTLVHVRAQLEQLQVTFMS